MDAETNEKCELCWNMRAVVKFYCLKGKTQTKTFEKMKFVYGDDRFGWALVFVLHKKFFKVRETVGAIANTEDNRGQPLTVSTKINVNTVRILIEEDRSLICWETVAMMDCSKSMIKKISCTKQVWFQKKCLTKVFQSFQKHLEDRVKNENIIGVIFKI